MAKIFFELFSQKIDKFLTHENLVHVLYQVKKSPGLPQWSRTVKDCHSGPGLPTAIRDCHSGPGLQQTFPVHIAEISLDITKSSSLGVWQSDLSYRTMSQCLLLTTECESESTKTQCDFTFTYGQNSRHGTLSFYKHDTVITWYSILSLYFSRTMLKYDQNVPLNKQSYLYRSYMYQYFGRSATSHYFKNTVNIDRLYSWMGHHTG